MTFWEVNKKKIVLFAALQFTVPFLFIYFITDAAFIAACCGASIVLVFGLAYTLPAAIAFKVIPGLLADTSSFSILPLFDAGYTVAFRGKDSMFTGKVSRYSYAQPNIHAAIMGLPVVVYFIPQFKTQQRQIVFRFYPLLRPGSNTIFEDKRAFDMPWTKRLETDVKQEVRDNAAELKQKGYYSAVGIAIKYVQVDSVADRPLQ